MRLGVRFKVAFPAVVDIEPHLGHSRAVIKFLFWRMFCLALEFVLLSFGLETVRGREPIDFPQSSNF
jgi:hypothetical protein